MSTRSENTVTINHSAEKVHQALTNEKYWAYIAENLSPEPGELNEFSNNEAILFELLPVTILPEAVRAMVSQSLKVKSTSIPRRRCSTIPRATTRACPPRTCPWNPWP